VISIIIPVKNGMPYIRETLESIQCQTYQNFEVLVWDNGSTDGTVELLKQWIPSKLNGTVVADQPMSYPLSLAALVDLSKYEFIARIDADDVMLPTRLVRQLSVMQSNSHLGVLGSHMYVMDEVGEITGSYGDLPRAHESIMFRLLGTRNPVPHPSVMLRKSMVLAAGNYHDVYGVDDLDLWLRMADHGDIHIDSQYLTIYRILANSVTRELIANQSILQRVHNVLVENSKRFGLSREKLSAVYRGDQRINVFDVIHILKIMSIERLNSENQTEMYDMLVPFISKNDLVSRLWMLIKCKVIWSRKMAKVVEKLS
jgi:glycosyltransferase involved in cell wall biosynthesis